MTDLEIDEREAKLNSDGQGGNAIWSGLTGDAHQNFVKKWSPATYFDKNMPPVITIQGDKDTLVTMIHANSMAERLNKIGVHNKLILMPGANHGGFTEKQFYVAWDAIFSFLNQEI